MPPLEWLIVGAALALGSSAGSTGGGTSSGSPPPKLPPNDPFLRFDEHFLAFGAQEAVDPWTLKAIAMNESSLGDHPSVARGIANPFDIEASKSDDGLSWGLMQMTLKTLRDFDPTGQAVQLNAPAYSVRYAAKFVRWLERQFPKSDPRWLEWVVKSYNQGAGRTQQAIRGEKTDTAGAIEYWARFQRNRERIRQKQGV